MTEDDKYQSRLSIKIWNVKPHNLEEFIEVLHSTDCGDERALHKFCDKTRTTIQQLTEYSVVIAKCMDSGHTEDKLTRIASKDKSEI